MTVSSEVNRSDFAGNGSTTNFATGFRFLQNADIRVILTITATGVETVQVLDTDYTLTGEGLDAGGTVIMTVAPPTGTTLTIKRDIDVTQLTDYVENDPFPAESHEEALDKLTMLVQQQQEEIDRSLKLSESQQSSGLQIPAPIENNLLRWDASGNLVNVTEQQLGTVAEGDLIKKHVTVAAMIADTSLVSGRVVATSGYLDGWAAFLEPKGSSHYDIATLASVRTAKSDGAWVPDEQINHTLASGLVAMLKFDGIVDSYQAGAVADGVANDTAAVQAGITAAAIDNFKFYIVPGTHMCDALTIPAATGDGTEIFGNRKTSIIKTNSGQDNHALIISNLSDILVHDLTIDQNRTGNTLGHGIRLQEVSGVSLYNLDIIETAGYGIGAQVGQIRDFTIRDVLIDGTVNDGIDIKNTLDTNENIQISNITVKNFGTTTGKAGVDIRGPALLDNIYVEINELNSIGVRFRVDDSPGTGVGGRRSSISNFRIKRLAGATTTGVICNGEYVKLVNGWVEDTAVGYSDLIGKCKYSNCVALNTTIEGFTLVGTRSSFSNCNSDGGVIGFDIEGNRNQLVNCTATGNSTWDIRTQATADETLINGGEITASVALLDDQGTNSKIRDLIGYRNATNVVSAGVPVDSTGTKAFSIAHGLDAIPSVTNIQLTTLVDTATTGYVFNFLRVDSIDATNVNGSLGVGTASGVGGATIKINASIDASN